MTEQEQQQHALGWRRVRMLAQLVGMVSLAVALMWVMLMLSFGADTGSMMAFFLTCAAPFAAFGVWLTVIFARFLGDLERHDYKSDAALLGFAVLLCALSAVAFAVLGILTPILGWTW